MLRKPTRVFLRGENVRQEKQIQAIAAVTSPTFMWICKRACKVVDNIKLMETSLVVFVAKN